MNMNEDYFSQTDANLVLGDGLSMNEAKGLD